MPSSRINDRRCIATGEALGPHDLALRFVLSPTGEIVLDLKASLPGRGVWVTPERKAVAMALAKGLFARGFKAAAKLPAGTEAEDFLDQIAASLAASALQRLGLCRRAGVLVTGHDATRQHGSTGVAYLTPADASAAETQKLATFLAKSAGIPHFRLPGRRFEVGEAIGQDAVHLLLLPGGPSAGTLTAIRRWSAFAS